MIKYLIIAFIAFAANIDAGNWYIEGWASTEEMHYDGSFTGYNAKLDMIEDVNKHPVVFQFRHRYDKDHHLGYVIEAKMIDRKMWVKVRLNEGVAQDIVEGIMTREYWSMSVGFYHYNRRIAVPTGGHLYYYADLIEISLCPRPADPGATLLRFYYLDD